MNKHTECPRCQGELVETELGIVIVSLTEKPPKDRQCESCGYIVPGQYLNGKNIGHIDDICYPSRNRVSNH